MHEDKVQCTLRKFHETNFVSDLLVTRSLLQTGVHHGLLTNFCRPLNWKTVLLFFIMSCMFYKDYLIYLS